MVPTNVLQRTFNIGIEDSAGSAFTIDVDNRQYLVTARHVVDEFQGGEIKISSDGTWQNIPCELVGHGDENIDVSVLALDKQLSPTHPLPAASKGAILGQTAYFVGFPYNRQIIVPPEMNGGFPLPLVKSGVISSIAGKTEDGISVILIDGHNNPGFSGGPVVFVPDGVQPGGGNEFCVAGVVSAYPTYREPVFDPKGNETDLYIMNNPGFVIAHDIQYALDIIEANPIGFELPQVG